MPRQPRQFEVGNIYHVVKRGVEKRNIFLKSQDYHRFTLALEFSNDEDEMNLWELFWNGGKRRLMPAEIKERLLQKRQTGKKRLVDLLGFALMPNHFHLILREIIVGGISKFMQKLGGYSTYFNQQYERVGSLFQGRYKAVPVTTNEQLLVVFLYVHTNPVELIEPRWKDFVVKDPVAAAKWLKGYRWSSYPDHIGEVNFPEVTQREFFLKFFGSEQQCEKAVEDWIKFRARNTTFGPEIIE